MDIFGLAFTYINTLQSTPLGYFLYIPLILILLDVITGVSAALKQGVFTWKQVDAFLLSNVAPYLLVVALVFAVYCYSGSVLAIQVSIPLGMLAHAGSVLGSIMENLKELGVSAPVVQEVEQMGQSFIQQPQVSTWSSVPPAPTFVPPNIDKVNTQVHPIVQPEVVRVNTPAPVPPPIASVPVEVVPPLAQLPTGL